MKQYPLIVTHTKLMKVLNLSEKEINQLEEMKKVKDTNGIKNFFTNNEKYQLHSASFNIINCGHNILMFCSHATLDTNVIVIVYNNVVYEYFPKYRQRLFLGGATNTIYSVGFMENVKSVRISFYDGKNKICYKYLENCFENFE